MSSIFLTTDVQYQEQITRLQEEIRQTEETLNLNKVNYAPFCPIYPTSLMRCVQGDIAMKLDQVFRIPAPVPVAPQAMDELRSNQA